MRHDVLVLYTHDYFVLVEQCCMGQFALVCVFSIIHVALK